MNKSTDIPVVKRDVHSFDFTGDSREYFKIWVSNNFLTMLTLGIYSAWAKVRRLQYFYGNTYLADSSFRFTALPTRVLMGRLIAAALFVLYVVADELQTTLANTVFFLLIVGYLCFSPILTVLVFSFKLRYSEWRGLKFRFHRDFKRAYKVYLGPNILMALIFVCFGMAMNAFEETSAELEQQPIEISEGLEEASPESGNPVSADGRQQAIDEDHLPASNELEQASEDEILKEELLKRYTPAIIWAVLGGFFTLLFSALLPFFSFLHYQFMGNHAYLGTAAFKFKGSQRDYYQLYLRAFGLSMGFLLLGALFYALDQSGMVTLVVMLYYLSLKAFLKSRNYNLFINNTILSGKHSMRATTTTLGMLSLTVSNTLLIIVSLGWFIPWTQIRVARYILGNTEIVVRGSLDEFVGHEQEQQSAMGEEIADLFDIDLV